MEFTQSEIKDLILACEFCMDGLMCSDEEREPFKALIEKLEGMM